MSKIELLHRYIWGHISKILEKVFIKFIQISVKELLLMKDELINRRTHIWRNTRKYLSVYFLRIPHIYGLLTLNMACKNNTGPTKRIFIFLKRSSIYFKSYIYHINSLRLLLSPICFCLYYKNGAYQNYHNVNMTEPNALFPSSLAQHHTVFPLCYVTCRKVI